MLIRVLFVLTAFIVTQNASSADVRIVATVNGEVISSIDVMNHIKFFSVISNTELNDENREALFQQSLDKLIEGMLFVDKAKKIGVVVDPEEVESRLQDALRESNVMKRLHDSGFDADSLKEHTMLSMIQEKVILRDVVPYITVNQQEIDDFKEQSRNKLITFFELAKVNDGEEVYLGLFSGADINSTLQSQLNMTKVGSTTPKLSIKLLDKFKVRAVKALDRFDFMQLKSNTAENLKSIQVQKNVACDTSSLDVDGVTLLKVTDFHSDNTFDNNAIYKALLGMNVNDESSVLRIGDEYSIILLCGVSEHTQTDSDIQHTIFMRKLGVQRDNYLKNLKLGNVIRRYV